MSFSHYEQCPRCVANGRDTRRDNLAVYSDGSKHCFSCQYHVFPKYFTVTKEIPLVTKNLLPADFTREVPSRALPWLLQYGLTYSYWEPYIGYSPAEERLVFTVNSVESQVAFSIGRYVGEKTGKEAPRKWYCWGDSHKHCTIIGNQTIRNTYVLVEDLISAHKVAQVDGLTAIPLFGTRVHNPVLYYLMSTDAPVVLWLDKDQELNVRRQALNLESLINRRVKVVVTDLDPKELSFEDIRNIC